MRARASVQAATPGGRADAPRRVVRRFALRYDRVVFTDPATMTEEQRQWVELSRKLWRRAERIAAQHPGMDVSGVYHVLWNLRRSVEERLRQGLILDALRPQRR
jgi:hypothetical protein